MAGEFSIEWRPDEVGDWVSNTLGLPQYADVFKSNHIGGGVLLTIGVQDLKDIGVKSVGHRRKIIQAIEDLVKSNTGSCRPRDSKRVLKIAIEGNIAAGKSTFCDILSREIDFICVPEPVSRWQTIGNEDEMTLSQQQGGNLLDMFYKGPHRWGYTFQSYAFLSRMRAQMQPISYFSNKYAMGPTSALNNDSKSPKKAAPKAQAAPMSPVRRNRPKGDASVSGASLNSPVKKKRVNVLSPNPNKRLKPTTSVEFFERSVYSDRYCFALNCQQSGLFNDTEWAIYQDWHSYLCDKFGDKDLYLDGFIYLRTDPKTCVRRLKKRSRSEESSVGIDYLESLHGKHESWLMDKEIDDDTWNKVSDLPILVLDANSEFEKDPQQMKDHLHKIRNFLKQLEERQQKLQNKETSAEPASPST